MTSAAEPGPLPHARDPLSHARDPLSRVLGLGRRELPTGVALGLMGALGLHGAGVYRAATMLFYLGEYAAHVQAVVVERQRAMVDIDAREAEKPPPPELAPPEEKSDPAPAKRPDKVQARDAAERPPPAAAEAGKVLTSEPDPEEPLDLTDNTFVSGKGDRYAGGTTAADGTSKTAVHDPRAVGSGTPAPSGNGRAPKPIASSGGRDRSRAATPESRNWQCGFPPEADADQVDFATVTITVTVGADGRAKSVNVLSDPGHGFGRLARSCALRMRYNPGYDKDGQPITKTTSAFPVRFTR